MRIGTRLDFETAMLMVALSVSSMATCSRRSVGCVLTKDKIVVATGYNGAVKGKPHCQDVGCILKDGHCIACVHAEANASMRCAEADSAFCTDRPCLTCLRLMLQKAYFRRSIVRLKGLKRFELRNIRHDAEGISVAHRPGGQDGHGLSATRHCDPRGSPCVVHNREPVPLHVHRYLSAR